MPLHTQREEDIKNYRDSLLGKRIEASEVFFINHGFPEWKGETVPDFISNIYIKIAEEQRKRWLDIFKYHADSSNELHLFMRNTAHTEMDYWQEELNKLK